MMKVHEHDREYNEKGLKEFASRKNIPMNEIAIQYRKETGPKAGCFAGFCHHRLMTMSAHMNAILYICLKVEQRRV